MGLKNTILDLVSIIALDINNKRRKVAGADNTTQHELCRAMLYPGGCQHKCKSQQRDVGILAGAFLRDSLVPVKHQFCKTCPRILLPATRTPSRPALIHIHYQTRTA